jgi:predicted ATP-grasp superfamily ATP-dependent carboligase
VTGMAARSGISPVFVEGLDVSAYGIARAVGRRGVPVYALNDRLRDPLRFSRYCRGCFLYSDDPAQPRAYAGDSVANEEVLCRLMLEWGAGFSRKPVLFATSDWFARFLSNQQQPLREKFLFHWAPPELFTTIVDKGRMVRFCERAGVRVPRTHITRPEDDMAQVTRGFAYPCLVKPVHRYTAGFPVETAKVLIAQDAQQAQGFFEKYPQLKGGTLMQELIEGGDDQVFQCTALVNGAGEISAYSTVRKLRQYPPGFGSMCYGRTERNEAMAAEAFKLLRALGYRGLGSLEFKYRQKDGGYYFIEMNTRLPWYNGIFADAGVNLPYLAYLDLLGEAGSADHNAMGTASLQAPAAVRPAQPVSAQPASVPPASAQPVSAQPLPTQRDGATWVGFHNYAGWFREMKGKREIGPARFALHVAKAGSYAWWNWADPAPFLASLLLAARRLAGGVLRRLRLR